MLRLLVTQSTQGDACKEAQYRNTKTVERHLRYPLPESLREK